MFEKIVLDTSTIPGSQNLDWVREQAPQNDHNNPEFENFPEITETDSRHHISRRKVFKKSRFL